MTAIIYIQDASADSPRGTMTKICSRKEKEIEIDNLSVMNGREIGSRANLAQNVARGWC